MPGFLAALGPVIGALSGVVTGAIQKGKAAKAAQALPEPMSFSPTPQMVKAEEMFGKRAEMGLDPAELRVARQGITRSRGAAGRMMENMGLSRISQGMSNIYGMDAEMNLAALNAKAKQDAMNRYLGVAQGFQNIQDQEVTSFNQMLNQQRMALGAAGAAGGKNILSGIGTGVQGLATNQLANAYANSGDTYNYNLGGGGGAFGDFGGGGGGGTALDGLAGFGGGGGTALDGLAGFSDKRLKYNIIELGHSPSGIPIYSFKYKGGSVSYKGAMAQDLINMGLSDAVTVMSNGYYGVYYDMIDVDMELLN